MSTYPNIIAAKDARITELEAEVALLRRTNVELQQFINERANERDEWKARAEALSRTGAVKVKALEWEDREERRLGATTEKFWRAQTAFDWGYRVKSYGKGFSFGDAESYPTVDAAKAAAQADYERRILSALEPAAPEGQQEAVAWQHIPNCGVDRESRMVHVTGKVFCDPCIAPLVAALNAASIETVASCCGHGHRPGVIVLRDGRELFIAKDFEEARKVDAAFPTDINGDARPSEQAVTEAARAVCDNAKLVDIGKNGAFNYVVSPYLIDALKAAMEAGRHD